MAEEATAARGRQERLPGTDGGIPELEQLGFEYAGLRDQRMAILKQEVELKKKCLEAMQRHGKDTYRYEDLLIMVTPGEPKLKVKVMKDDDEEAA
jgi:hypothetical protein